MEDASTIIVDQSTTTTATLDNAATTSPPPAASTQTHDINQTGPNDDNVVWAQVSFFLMFLFYFNQLYFSLLIKFIYGATMLNRDDDRHRHHIG